MNLMDWLMPAAVVASTAVNVVYSNVTARTRASKREIDGIRTELKDEGDKIGALETRMTTLETKVTGLPTNDVITNLTQELSKLNRELGEISGEFSGVQNRLGNIETALLSRISA